MKSKNTMNAHQNLTDADVAARNALVEKYNRAKTKPTKARVYKRLMELEEQWL